MDEVHWALFSFSFALIHHILHDSIYKVPGIMGKRDMMIVEAIYKYIEEGGKKINLNLGRMGIID